MGLAAFNRMRRERAEAEAKAQTQAEADAEAEATPDEKPAKKVAKNKSPAEK